MGKVERAISGSGVLYPFVDVTNSWRWRQRRFCIVLLAVVVVVVVGGWKEIEIVRSVR